MTASRDFPLNEGTVRFADLAPTHSPFVEDVRGPLGLETQFNIVESRWTPTLPHRRVEASSGFSVMGRRRRGAGAGAEYRCSAAEVLVAHAGRWRVAVGDGARDGTVELGIGDVMSVPTGAIRRVDLLDGVDGFLFVVRGSVERDDEDPEIARCAVSAQGDLRAIRGGQWIDDTGGVPVLRTVRVDEHSNAVSPPEAMLARWVRPAAVMQANVRSAFAAPGIAEASVIGCDSSAAEFASGTHRAGWRHGFSLRLLTLDSGAYVPAHRRSEPFAFVIQDGMLEVRSSDEAIMLGAGDVMSMPLGLEHSLRNTTSRPTRAFVVLGAEDPAAPDFSSRPLPGRG